MRTRRWKPPTCVCEMLEGRPGSGKSFKLLTDTLDAILTEARPVYTNLPLNMRVIKQYLRNRKGKEYADLIRPLTREHFLAFLRRSVVRATERQLSRDDAMAAGRPWSGTRFSREFEEKHGETVYHGGPGSNWIAEGSLIIIDECHHWFPMRNQKEEPPELLAYLTMHRHHLHSLLWATQQRMQVSITIRRLCSAFWHVRNKGDDRIAWGLQLRHFGFQALAYGKYTPEAEEAFDAESSRPIETKVVFPWLPSERWKFRLYRSFTHMDSTRRMMRAMQRVRHDAGIGEDGERIITAEEQAKAKEDAVMRRPRIIKKLGRMGLAGAALVIAGGIGLAAGRATYTQGAHNELDVVMPDWWAGWALEAVTSKGIMASGKRVAIGERMGPHGLLLSTSPRGRVAAFDVAADGVYVWEVGAESPRRIGSAGEVKRAIAEAEAIAGRAVSLGIRTDASAGSGGLAAPVD